MYHIKDDLRCQKTVNLIIEAFDECMKQTPEKITISDICNLSTVSRSTFYRLFDTVDDVIRYKFDDYVKQFINESKASSAKDIIYEFCHFWEKNVSFLEYIINNNKEVLFYQAHCEHIDYLNTIFSQNDNPPLTEEYVSIMTSFVINFMYSCKKNKNKLDFNSLLEMINQFHSIVN